MTKSNASNASTLAQMATMLSGLATTMQALNTRLDRIEAGGNPLPPALPSPQPYMTPGTPILTYGQVPVQTPAQVPSRAPAPPLPSRPVIAAPVQMAPVPQVQVPSAPVPQAAPVGPAYSREEQGGERYHKCALCNQDDRMGTVVVATGEYLVTGMTTEFLKALASVQVIVTNADGSRTACAVSGNWLVDELKRRPATTTGTRVRAISVPAFLAMEPGGAHPTIALASPVLRRATREEESVQRINRAASWLASLDPTAVIQAAQKGGPSGLARLVGAAQDLVAFAGKVTGPLVHNPRR